MITRRSGIIAALALAATFALSACGGSGGGAESSKSAAPPREIVFSILSAENQASMEPLWTPLINDMSAATGVRVRPFFASNYTALIEAMRAECDDARWAALLQRARLLHDHQEVSHG